MTTPIRIVCACAAVVVTLAAPSHARGQGPPPGVPAEPLDSLVAHALAVHPALRAAAERVEAARASVRPAATPPDPMLMAGIQNFPVAEPGFGDFMTMKMLGLSQRFPYPGTLPLRRRTAEAEVAAAEARLAGARLQVVQEVRATYYEIAFLDHALEIVARTRDVLQGLVGVTEARYAAGLGGQSDVLRARVEAARLGEEAATLSERRRAALARLNAGLDRPSETPVGGAAIPDRISRAAVTTDPREVRFASPALGARAADSPLPPLDRLQEEAVRRSPALRELDAMIAAQAARVELARRAHLPDFDVSLQYGQRDGYPDMLSATVSVPLPVRRSRLQRPQARAAEGELAALQAERHQQANALRADVAAAYADLERERARLALYVRSILPQARAAVESAAAGYQVGRVEFLALLEAQATLFAYETEYHRALADFAVRLAELERIAGGEVLP